MVTQFEFYFTFLMEILQITQDSQGNCKLIYPLLQLNLDKIDGYLAQVLRQWATLKLRSVNQETARSIAGTISIFSNLIQDFPLGNPDNNLEIAFTGYEVVSSIFNRQDCSEAWAEVQTNLCRTYQKRTKGDSIDNIKKAISAGQSALEIYTHECNSKEWAATHVNLGNAYFFRVDGDPVENLEKSIECYQKALSVFNKENFPEQWAVAQNSMATAYLYNKRNLKISLEQAIRAYKLALKVCRREVFSKLWADIQNNMCIAYHNRIIGNHARNKELAIIHAKLALKVRTREAFPALWADTQNNLGIAYCERVKGNPLENLWLAVESYKAALKIYTRTVFPERWARTQNNLGTAYSEIWQPTLAIECFRSALEIYAPATFPVNCFDTGRNFGLTAYKFGDWDKAIEGYGTAIEAVEQSREWASRDSRKAEILSAAIDVYAGIVQVYININQPDKAIEYVERSKARNLVELLANKERYPKLDLYPNSEIHQTHCHQLEQLRRQIPAKQRELEILISSQESEERYRNEIEQRRQELTQQQQQRDELLAEINQLDSSFAFTQKVEPISFDDIQKLLPDDQTGIIQWYILGDRFLTFIITQSSVPDLWQSEPGDLQALNHWLDEYLQDYDRPLKTHWRDNLESRLHQLAEILHLEDILKRVPDNCQQVILIPHRLLHLLPLHAMPLPNHQDQCLLDKFPKGVRYAPSCQLLQLSQKQERSYLTHIFGIQNPTQDLTYASLQVQTICQHFDSKQVLVETAATKAAMINDNNYAKQLRSTHCLHFACHGDFNEKSPLESYLKLANNELLSLGEIFSLDINQCRLVTLSACETGLTDHTSISDEYIGLPSGFLFAGSPSVVSSLWKVEELATAFLMIKFYENLKKGEKREAGNVAIALKDAKIWLRDLTHQDFEKCLDEFMPQIEEILAKLSKGKRLIAESSLKQVRDRQARPFANPYYWAGFIATGR
ncbi:MAG TPA: CHAT domain-containing tetratricopeptide repeat protein [Microcoleus sp.]|nr:CHAT domain-containing tetratricopeptide repeat protein [Microcoleus sp.]